MKKISRLSIALYALWLGALSVIIGVFFHEVSLVFVGLVIQSVLLVKLPAPSFRGKRSLDLSDLYWYMGVFSLMEAMVLLAFSGDIL